MTAMKHSAQDRCDRCHAQTITTWVNCAGNILGFCGHHTKRYAPVLEAVGFTLSVDDLGILDAMHGARRDAASAV